MPPRDLTLSVVRPEDPLYLVLEFEGVQVTEPLAGQPGRAAKTAPLTKNDFANAVAPMDGLSLAELDRRTALPTSTASSKTSVRL